ncbi:MAG: carbonic anhydrase [Planctomycetota bacterium]|jgi:hypothetical protein
MHDHTDQTPSSYQSSVPFETQRIQAAAVYCSDGRFGEQVDDLLHNGLQLPRYDRLVVPGGGACLAGHFAARREEEAALAQLRFLIEAHNLQQVVFVAHEDCAFYTELLHISPMQLEAKQREDLEKVVSRVRGLAHGLTVVAYFARKQGDRVCFEPWDV